MEKIFAAVMGTRMAEVTCDLFRGFVCLSGGTAWGEYVTTPGKSKAYSLSDPLDNLEI